MTTSGSCDLDLYDIAFLAGGPARVVDTAVVDLVATGRVRIHAPGELAVADPSRRHPVEAAVLDAIGTRGHRTVDTVRWRVMDDDRLHAVGRRLVDAGLMHRLPWPRALRPDGRLLTRTRHGNGALVVVAAARKADPGHDPTSALLVALSGPAAMPDGARRAAIFDPPQPLLAPPPGRRRTRDVDPHLAAYRAGAASAAGGFALSGGFEAGGGFDGVVGGDG
jgi:hypothetical protein